MNTDCVTDPAGCLGDVVGGVVTNGASKAWEAVCQSFADAAMFLLKWFADAFVSFPDTDVRSVTSTYAISMWIAGIIAALLLIGQVIRTAVTHDGSALAHGLVGVGKALLAVIATLTVAHTALVASDEIAQGIIDRSLGGNDGLKKSLTGLFEFAGNPAPGTATTIPMSLVFVLAIVGIVLTGVLWFEMLLRNAAIAVLVATAPIAAAGQISESTKSWWAKACAATIQLIILKPVITLIFAIGFGIAGTPADTSKPADLVTILAGLLILLLAVVAWPVIARFFTFASVQVGGAAGLGAVLGFAAGRANAGSGPAGVNPAQFSQATEARTMAAASESGAGAMGGAAGVSGVAPTAGASGAGAGAGAAGGAAAGAAGAVALPLLIAKAGVDMGQRAVNSLSGRMEQTASHAGIAGANHYARPAGHPAYSGSWTNPGGAFSSSQPGGEASDSGVAPAPPADHGNVHQPAEAGPSAAEQIRPASPVQEVTSPGVDPPPPTSAGPRSPIEENPR